MGFWEWLALMVALLVVGVAAQLVGAFLARIWGPR